MEESGPAAFVRLFHTGPEYNPELPTGFVEACFKYPDYQQDSVEDLWQRIHVWREYEKSTALQLEVKKYEIGERPLEEAIQEIISTLKIRILKGVLEDDKVFLADFFKAIQSAERPMPEMNAVRAATKAFFTLFCAEGKLVSREDWPTKQEVRRLTEETLTANGYPLPTERHWPRIYKQAGLSELLSVTHGRAHKRKSPGAK
jgi:hypothetical protein